MTENGRLFAEKAGEKIEVVIATAKQAAALPGGGGRRLCSWKWGYWSLSNLSYPRDYLLRVMIVAAFSYRVPPKIGNQRVGSRKSLPVKA